MFFPYLCVSELFVMDDKMVTSVFIAIVFDLTIQESLCVNICS